LGSVVRSNGVAHSTGLVGLAALLPCLLLVSRVAALSRTNPQKNRKPSKRKCKLQAENTDLKQKLASQDGSESADHTEQSPEIQERHLKILSAVDSMIDTG